MMMKMQAYAKINLTLDISGRREDGYHMMRMVMQSVSLCDTVFLLDTPKREIGSSRDDVPCGPENTVQKAAAAFFSSYHAALPRSSFYIRKNIPQQAGLGGGSADAAAALVLLNRRFGTGLSREELCSLGLSAGADVPFCLYGGTALAEGVGEKLSALPALPLCRILICKPPVGISTKEAFESFDASGGMPERNTDAMIEALRSGSLQRIAKCLGNAFEKTCDLPEEVRQIEAVMLAGGSAGACMTGSGSAVFGIFDAKSDAAARCRGALLKKYPETFLCRPVWSDDVGPRSLHFPGKDEFYEES